MGLPSKDWEAVREALPVLLTSRESVGEGEGEALREVGDVPAAVEMGDGMGTSVAEGVADPRGRVSAVGMAEAVGEGVPATTPDIATLSTLREPVVPLRPAMAQQKAVALLALDGACAR